MHFNLALIACVAPFLTQTIAYQDDYAARPSQGLATPLHNGTSGESDGYGDPDPKSDGHDTGRHDTGGDGSSDQWHGAHGNGRHGNDGRGHGGHWNGEHGHGGQGEGEYGHGGYEGNRHHNGTGIWRTQTVPAYVTFCPAPTEFSPPGASNTYTAT